MSDNKKYGKPDAYQFKNTTLVTKPPVENNNEHGMEAENSQGPQTHVTKIYHVPVESKKSSLKTMMSLFNWCLLIGAFYTMFSPSAFRQVLSWAPVPPDIRINAIAVHNKIMDGVQKMMDVVETEKKVVKKSETSDEVVQDEIQAAQTDFHVDSYPQGAYIYIDKVNTGQRTPAAIRLNENQTFQLNLKLGRGFTGSELLNSNSGYKFIEIQKKK